MRWLVIWAMDGGSAGINNVRVIEAATAEEAIYLARQLDHTTSTAYRAYDLKEIPHGWGWYQ